MPHGQKAGCSTLTVAGKTFKCYRIFVEGVKKFKSGEKIKARNLVEKNYASIEVTRIENGETSTVTDIRPDLTLDDIFNLQLKGRTKVYHDIDAYSGEFLPLDEEE